MLNYFFYVVYKFVIKTPSKNEEPHHITNILLSILFTFDIIFLIDVLNKYLVKNIQFHNNYLNNIFLYALIFSLIYLTIIKDKKYLNVIEAIDSKTKRFKICLYIAIISWILFTVVIGTVI